MKRAIAYTRVSTPAQGKSGLGLAAQQAQIDAFAKEAGLNIVKRFSEVASGKGAAMERPVLQEVLKEAIKRRLVVVVADMDRFGRDASSVRNILETGGLQLHVAALGKDVDLAVLKGEAAKAQRHGELLSERTRAGLKKAKAAGVKLGNPKILEAQKKGAAEAKRKAAIRAEEQASEIEEVISAVPRLIAA